jgi:hypothetical protein
MRHYSTGGAPSRPRISAWSRFTGAEAYPRAEYLFVLTVVVLVLLATEGRGRVGRAWMAIRGMDVAAEIIGIRPLRTKLLARLRDRPLVPDIDAKGGIKSGGADDLKIASFTLHISADGGFGTDGWWAMEVTMGNDSRQKRCGGRTGLSVVGHNFEESFRCRSAAETATGDCRYNS